MFYVEVNAVENGSVVRIVSHTTGKYLAIGGFEGMQRYLAKHQIKTSKLILTCLNTEWEPLGHLSLRLTEQMIHTLSAPAQWIGNDAAAGGIAAFSAAVGINGLLQRVPGDQATVDGVTVLSTRTTSAAACWVTLPDKRGAFNAPLARSRGVTERTDLIALIRTGQVEIAGKTLRLEEFTLPPTKYPALLVITLTQALTNPEDLASIVGAISQETDVYLRVGPNIFTDRAAKYHSLAQAAQTISQCLAGVPYPTRVFPILDSEEPVPPVAEFHARLSQADSRVLSPHVFDVSEFQSYFPNLVTLTDRGVVDYAKKDNLLPNQSQAAPTTTTTTPTTTPTAPYCVFLGTGAAVPTTTRNVSAILVTSPKGGVLLDCGEDTATQLNKISTGFSYAFDDLNLIALSHRHADHTLGIFSVVKKANDLGNTSILVIGEPSLAQAFSHFQLACLFVEITADLKITHRRSHQPTTIIDQLVIERSTAQTMVEVTKQLASSSAAPLDPYHYQLGTPRHLKQTTLRPLDNSAALRAYLISQPDTAILSPRPVSLNSMGGDNSHEWEIRQLEFSPARHITNSQTTKLTEFTHSAPFVITYSGDTFPTDTFAKFSYQADIMIHEGTFEECDLAHAKETQHSTVTAAAEIFKASQAKQLIITHLSQRYKTVHLPCGYLAVDYLVFSSTRSEPQTDLLAELQALADKTTR